MERHRWVKWLGLTVAVGCGGELATPAEVEDGDLGTARAKVIVQREVLAPTADTHAVAADPARNYGRADLLRVDGGPNGTVEAETYLRFQVPELQGVLTSAKLRLYATRASPRGAVALSSRGGGWSEYTLSWNTRLQAADQIASSTGPVAANSWVELDVTSIARGAFQGITTVIVRAAGEDSLFFASRNAADPSLRPQLLVTAEAAENLPTPLPLQPPMPVPADPPLSADACLSRREIFELSLGVNNNYFTDRTAPNTSFESRSILSVDADPRREAFVGTYVPDSYPAVRRLALRLFAETGTNNGPRLFAASAAPPFNVTWNNRPLPTSGVVADVAAIAPNSWVDYNLTPLISSGQRTGVVLVPDSTDEVTFVASRGVDLGIFPYDLRPQLLLETQTPPYCTYRGTSPGGTVLAARRVGSAATERVLAKASDAQGNAVLVAEGSAGATFGGQPLAVASNLVLVKYGPNGAHQWTRALSATGVRPTAVALTSLGNILVAGTYAGSPDVGTGPLPQQSPGFFIAKYAPDGRPVWSRGFYADAVDYDGEGRRNTFARPTGVATDAQGSLVVTGVFGGDMNLGGDNLDAGPYSRAEQDAVPGIFLAKFTWEGNHLWSRAIEFASSESVATDPAGNVLLGGTVSGEPLVAKYAAASGAPAWTKTLVGARGVISRVAGAPNGEVIIAGSFDRQFQFAGGAYVAPQPPGEPPPFDYVNGDALVGRLSSGGDELAMRTFGGTDAEGVSDLVVTSDGSAFISGVVGGAVDLGLGTVGSSEWFLRSPFILKTNPAGAPVWSRVFDSRLEALQLISQPSQVTAVSNFDRTLEVDGRWLQPAGGSPDVAVFSLRP